jgi:hypothetical protein
MRLPPEGIVNEEIHQRIEAEFGCEHESVHLTKRVASNGAVSFPMQCLRCGRETRVVRKGELTRQQMEAAPAIDPELKTAYWQARSARYQELHDALRDREREEWFARYDAYLLTPEWARRRRAVLRRAKGTCEGCLVRPATQVHHLTYERVGREMLFDLAAVCDECHAAIHSDEGPREGFPSEFSAHS